jgi:hypothetical protein
MRLLTRNAGLKPSVRRYKYWQNFGWVSEVARKLVTGKVSKASIDPSTATFSEKQTSMGVNEWNLDWSEIWSNVGTCGVLFPIFHTLHTDPIYILCHAKECWPLWKDSYIFFKCNVREKSKRCCQTSSCMWFNRNWRIARTYSTWRWRYQISPKYQLCV